MAYIPFLPDCYFHIYNRGNNRENIFLEERNYEYFLRLYQKYISPAAHTLAFCLLPNHFHFLVRFKGEAEVPDNKPISRRFANLFIAYSKAINNTYGRRGSLFEKHLKRKLITNERYFRTLVVYIHRNPQTHGLTSDFRAWPYSSFPLMNQSTNEFLNTADLIGSFDSLEELLQAHISPPDDGILEFGGW